MSLTGPDGGLPDRVTRVDVELVDPSPYQPRTRFDAGALEELAASIREQGLLQPVVVRPKAGRFELIAGERRLRAVRLLKLRTIPALIREMPDAEAMEAALVENLQREEISLVEAARAYQRLAEEFGHSLAELGRRTGKSRAAVSNLLRLLQLPQGVLALLEAGEISEGHARTLLALPYADLQQEMAGWIARNAVSVRETERRVRILLAGGAARSAREEKAGTQTIYLEYLVEQLRRRCETQVELEYHQGAGNIRLPFSSDDELERLLQILGIEPG